MDLDQSHNETSNCDNGTISSQVDSNTLRTESLEVEIVEESTPKSLSQEDLTALAKKRNFVIEEIISTEDTYLKRLQAVLDVFIRPMSETHILEPADVIGQVSMCKNVER